jgi:hypothetical protein
MIFDAMEILGTGGFPGHTGSQIVLIRKGGGEHADHRFLVFL